LEKAAEETVKALEKEKPRSRLEKKLRLMGKHTVKHQLLISRLIYILNKELKGKNCKNCFVLPEIEWKINKINVIKPDISVVCGLKDLEDHLKVPPILVFEVVSPSSSKRDEGLKFELYRREGVKFYALVYPELHKFKIYEFKNGSAVLLEDKTYGKVEIPLRENCKFSIDLKELFGEEIAENNKG
jgi:Uma2 family endonuclease